MKKRESEVALPHSPAAAGENPVVDNSVTNRLAGRRSVTRGANLRQVRSQGAPGVIAALLTPIALLGFVMYAIAAEVLVVAPIIDVRHDFALSQRIRTTTASQFPDDPVADHSRQLAAARNHATDEPPAVDTLGRCEVVPRCAEARALLRSTPTGRRLDDELKWLKIEVLPDEQMLEWAGAQYVPDNSAGTIRIAQETMRLPVGEVAAVLAHEETHAVDDRRESERQRKASTPSKAARHVRAIATRVVSRVPPLRYIPDPRLRWHIESEVKAHQTERRVKTELRLECYDDIDPTSMGCQPMTDEQVRNWMRTHPLYGELFAQRHGIFSDIEYPRRTPSDLPFDRPGGGDWVESASDDQQPGRSTSRSRAV